MSFRRFDEGIEVRDIAGANRFHIRSVLLAWSPRYQYEPSGPEEIPDYRIDFPEQLWQMWQALDPSAGQSIDGAQ